MEHCKDSISYKLSKSMAKNRFRFGDEVSIFLLPPCNKMTKEMPNSIKDIVILILLFYLELK
jgi:hypothetical protein